MGGKIVTPATELADKIMEYLGVLIEQGENMSSWHTKERMRVYSDGYEDCARACREAVIRAAEDTVFTEFIEAGVMRRFQEYGSTARARRRP